MNDDHAQDLSDTIYSELRAIAKQRFGNAAGGQGTLQPTAIVNEALLKLLRDPKFEGCSRTQLLAAAAVAMRCVVIDYARAAHRQKRGGYQQRFTLDTSDAAVTDTALDAVEMHDLLESFGKLHPRAARVVEMRVYAGMTVQEIAEALDVSQRTVKGDWRTALAWLRARLSEGGS